MDKAEIITGGYILKKFDNLNEEENKVRESLKGKTESKKSFSKTPIVVISIAVIILVVLCVHLFGKKPVNSQSNNKAYEVEIDGKTYSADTLEDLNKLVGFDVSYAFNNESDVERTTKIEKDLYEDGELATIETESGTYIFGVTQAIITQRPSDQGGEQLYKIDYVIENKDFDRGSGDGVGIYPDDLVVKDSNGNKCNPFTEYYNDEMINAYDDTKPGNKTNKTVSFKVEDAASEYLTVEIATRGVTCKIPVSNYIEFAEEHKEQKVSLGTPVTISDSSGKMIVTINSIRKDNDLLYEPLPDQDIVVIDVDLENIDYNNGNSDGIDGTYGLAYIIDVKDDNNYTLNINTDNLISDGDGAYSFYGTVSPGSKGRFALVYRVQKDCKSITVDFKNGSTLTSEL